MKEIIKVSQTDLHIISNDMAQHYRILPKNVTDSGIDMFIDESVYTADIRDEIELLTGKNVTFSLCAPEEIEKALALHYRKEKASYTKASLNIERNDFLDKLFFEARSLKSSDIHFEAYENSCRIRFRIDGQLIERYKIEKDSYLELVNKVKIRSKLNITEKRLPQDGRITTPDFDIRVSILPTLFGEKIVMRLLGQDASNIDLTSLGFKEEELQKYLEGVRKPNGIVLISGPTGSGKTTTLYATLKLLNDTKRNIVTVEDPIEYTLNGINQVQLKEDIGLTFASALRSFLRQDPDVIMLGEIRDPETALMAIRASLTGHLVLSTIHTNSAIGTISRLTDMGIPAYLIAETFNLSVAQRLVRKLCMSCRNQVEVIKENFPVNFSFPYDIHTHYSPTGCDECYHTGYKGRTAIYEVVTVTPQIAAAIKNNAITEHFDNDTAHQSLSSKAFDLLAEGHTSLDEIYPVLINS